MNIAKNSRRSFVATSLLSCLLVVGSATGASGKHVTNGDGVPARPKSTNSVLAEVVRQMEPALTDFLSTYSFDRVHRTMDRLEKKHRKKKLSVDFNISRDAKLFVVVKLSGKTHCYRGTGEYRIKLKKSSRCT